MSMFLGVDTSNYTTSLAAVDVENKTAIQSKRLLPVAEGALGLRQSDAVFHHTVQLPQLFDNLSKKCDLTQIGAVGVSETPRSESGSYMPCFLAGVSAASAFAASRRLELYKFSHQQGHIAAALFSAGKLELLKREFIAFHVSGGTTEAVIVRPDKECICSTQLVASSLDLKAGQAVDRVGVAMGLRFPAGNQLDEIACKCNDSFKIKPVLKDGNCSLSGVENKCKKMLADGEPNERVARYCIEYICAALDGMANALINEFGDMPLVFSGGVMSNSIISKKLGEKYGAYFAKPEFSCDNAVGTAVLTYMTEKKYE